MAKQDIYSVCEYSYQCKDTLYLACINGNCTCPFGSYWTGSICGKQQPWVFFFYWSCLFYLLIYVKIKATEKVYGDVCSANEQCRQLFNLQCSTSNYQCYCPTNYPSSRCDCPPTKYYDSTVGCRKKFLYTQFLFY